MARGAWRLRQEHSQTLRTCLRWPRLQQICDNLEWKLSEGLHGGLAVRTPCGPLELGVDSTNVVRQSAADCWLRLFRDLDPSLGKAKIGLKFHNRHLILDPFRSTLAAEDLPMLTKWRTIIGAPTGARALAVYEKKAASDFPCMCNTTDADATHLAFACPLAEQCGPVPDDVHEARYLLKSLPTYATPPHVLWAAMRERAVQDIRPKLRAQPPLCMATDGGANLSSGLEGASSWAVAFAVEKNGGTLDTEIATYGGVIEGLDHSPIFVEISAMLFAFEVAATLGVTRVVFITDNKHVCDITSLILANKPQPPPKVAPLLWRKIRSAARLSGLRWHVGWCPSHDKKKGLAATRRLPPGGIPMAIPERSSGPRVRQASRIPQTTVCRVDHAIPGGLLLDHGQAQDPHPAVGDLRPPPYPRCPPRRRRFAGANED